LGTNTGCSRWILTKMDKKTMTMPEDRSHMSELVTSE
jgi:hypothetical protein